MDIGLQRDLRIHPCRWPRREAGTVRRGRAGALVLRLEDDRPVDQEALRDCFDVPRAVQWSGVVVNDGPG